MAKVKISDLSKEIAKNLQTYTRKVTEGMDEAKIMSANEGVKHLRSGSKPKRTGDYLAGWARKEVGNSQVIYNRTDYQLTHLLEFGHVNRDGSRTPGYAHIRPTEDEVIKLYIDLVEKVIRG